MSLAKDVELSPVVGDQGFDPKCRGAIELTKTMTKLMGRLERIMMPVGSIILTDYMLALPQRVESFIKQRVRSGDFYQMSASSGRLVVHWDAFNDAVIALFAEGHHSTRDTGAFVMPKDMIDDLDAERYFQEEEERKHGAKERMRILQLRNGQPIMPGKWHKEAYVKRIYTELENYTVTPFISEAEADAIRTQLITPLDGFVGQAYNYDDHGLTEEWMVTFADGTSEAPSDDEVIRVQCSSLLDILTAQVQDIVCNELEVLRKEPVGLYSGKLREAQVWGIDCYTRRMIEIAIEDRVGVAKHSSSILREAAAGDTLATEGPYTDKDLHNWLERVLLPGINAHAVETAHNMLLVTERILANHTSGAQVLTEMHATFTAAVNGACTAQGIDMFRIHPKGTGIICTAPEGIQPHVLISEYLGDIYPPYRWCERLDVVEQAQQKYSLKPTLPDFYNILLERPRQDPQGYGLLFVDASQKSNMGSSCSHSCAANTSANVVARNGQLTIALTTNRYVHPYEELTMDYSAMTTSDIEWRAAICLCGSPHCRGSFLHYATQEDLQQVLNQNCGPLWRYASLLKSCSTKPFSKADEEAMDRHGIRAAALNEKSKLWMKKYAADNLRFLEFERKALPCSLMRPVDGKKSGYTFSQADLDARSVMEQRLQSLVCCFSMLQRVVDQQPQELVEMPPLSVVGVGETIAMIWEYLKRIPTLVEEHVQIKAPEQSKKKGSNVSLPSLDPVMPPDPTVPDSNKENVMKPSVGTGSELDGEIAKTLVPVVSVPLQPSEIAYFDYAAKRLRLKEAIAELKTALVPTHKPSSLTILRALCLQLREIVLKIEDLSTSTARLGLLADLLVLWAYTSNFSKVNQYAEIVSMPIPVVARDLGMCVPRSKVYNPTSKRIQGTKPEDLPASAKPFSWDKRAVHDESPKVEPAKSVIEDLSMDVYVPTSAEATAAAIHAGDKSGLCDPNEVVHTGSKKYGSKFAFDQLMSWFNAGTDEKLAPPDVTGCVQLPLPSMCFGPSDSAYGGKQRELLLEHLGDDKAQSMSWPTALKACFNYRSTGVFSSADGDSSSKPKKDQIDMTPASEKYRMREDTILGSPMLDVALGQVDAVVRVMQELLGADRAQVWLAEKAAKKFRAARKARKAKGDEDMADDDDTQFDAILPPEIPTAWVQCEGCRKWRRVPWHIDSESLPDAWYCRDNTWEVEKASCEAEQDVWDPTRESTLETVGAIEKEDTFEKGTWRDVFCNRNQCYYEAQIKQVKTSKVKLTADSESEFKPTITDIRFHFKGWGPSFDEWISVDSGRIAPLNLYTNPNPSSNHPSDQERWQGKKSSYSAKEAKASKEQTAIAKPSRKRKTASNSTSAVRPKKSKPSKVDWNAIIY